MMFPGAGAQIYRNEAGEPTGWDYPSYDDGPDPDDYYEQFEDYDDDEGEDDIYICDIDGEEFDNLNDYDGHREEQHGKGAE